MQNLPSLSKILEFTARRDCVNKIIKSYYPFRFPSPFTLILSDDEHEQVNFIHILQVPENMNYVPFIPKSLFTPGKTSKRTFNSLAKLNALKGRRRQLNPSKVFHISSIVLFHSQFNDHFSGTIDFVTDLYFQPCRAQLKPLKLIR